MRAGPTKPKTEGSILALATVVLLALLLVALLGGQVIWSYYQHQRHQHALEATALQAASDLSEIVINDPYFGFVSLSDRPAIGSATIAGDGEPIPVHGINTLIATSRLDYLIASELDDERLKSFAIQDIEQAARAAKDLDEALMQALQERGQKQTNMDGDPVLLYEHALRVYCTSIGCSEKEGAENLSLTLGWLKNFGSTITAVPKIGNKLTVPNQGQVNGCYKAFIDLPLDGQHFSFAGVGSQPSLVNAAQFVTADDKHISTIVKVEANCQVTNFLPWETSSEKLYVQACAQPYALSCQPPSSVLHLVFPDGLPPGVSTMHDLIAKEELNQPIMHTFIPTEGDFPIDKDCRLIGHTNQRTPAGAFVLAFYDWLRSNSALPQIDSVLATLNQRLEGNSPQPSFVLGIASDGTVILSQLLMRSFPELVTYENQWSAISDPLLMGNSHWTVTCRDEVHSLGTIAGGKHAGEPLPGNPINWDELSGFVSEPFAHAAQSRRPWGVALTGIPSVDGGIAFLGAQLTGKNGRELERALRTSTYAAGLAGEIVISHARAGLMH